MNIKYSKSFYTSEFDELVNKPPKFIDQYGIILFSIIILFLFLITWFIRYPDILLVDCKVKFEFQSLNLYIPKSGKITRVFIKENQIVSANQPLALVGSITDYESLTTLKKLLYNKNLDTSLFLINSSKQFGFNYHTEKHLNAISNSINNEADSLKIQFNSHLRLKSNLISQAKVQEGNLNIIQEKYKKDSILFDKKLINIGALLNSRDDLKDHQMTYLKIQLMLENCNNELIKIQKQILELKLYNNQKENKLRESLLQLRINLIDSITNWENESIIFAPINGKVIFKKSNLVNKFFKGGESVLTIISSKREKPTCIVYIPDKFSKHIHIGQRITIYLQSSQKLIGKINTINRTLDKDRNEVNIEIPIDNVTNMGLNNNDEIQGNLEITSDNKRLLIRLFNLLNL